LREDPHHVLGAGKVVAAGLGHRFHVALAGRVHVAQRAVSPPVFCRGVRVDHAGHAAERPLPFQQSVRGAAKWVAQLVVREWEERPRPNTRLPTTFDRRKYIAPGMNLSYISPACGLKRTSACVSSRPTPRACTGPIFSAPSAWCRSHTMAPWLSSGVAG